MDTSWEPTGGSAALRVQKPGQKHTGLSNASRVDKVFPISVAFPCGRPAPREPDLNQGVQGQTRLVGASHCPKGECPWQVNTLPPTGFCVHYRHYINNDILTFIV